MKTNGIPISISANYPEHPTASLTAQPRLSVDHFGA